MSRAMRHIPNLICLFRMFLIVPLVIAMRDGEQVLILLLFSISAVSDALDGYLAKRFNWTSDLGRFLDPMADKLLLVCVFVTAAWLDIAPWWVAAVAVARDLVIAGGALVYRLWFGPLRGRPNVISKINTGVQIAYLLAVILASASGLPPARCSRRRGGAGHHCCERRRLCHALCASRGDSPRCGRARLTMQQLPLGVRLQDRATFASFHDVASAQPSAALRAALAGADSRMLFVHGPEGSGKSHLLQAGCAAMLRTAYFPLRQLLSAGPGVLEGADGLALVAVDDLEEIAGEPEWERGLFKLYNDCESAGCRVVFAPASGWRAGNPASDLSPGCSHAACQCGTAG